jgi:hypothetical protein
MNKSLRNYLVQSNTVTQEEDRKLCWESKYRDEDQDEDQKKRKNRDSY